MAENSSGAPSTETIEESERLSISVMRGILEADGSRDFVIDRSVIVDLLDIAEAALRAERTGKDAAAVRHAYMQAIVRDPNSPLLASVDAHDKAQIQAAKDLHAALAKVCP